MTHAVCFAAALAACESYTHVDTPTTTSANVPPGTAQTTAPPVWSTAPDPNDSQMPFDLPKNLPSEEPAPVNPRIDHELEIDARAAAVRDAKITADIHDGIVNDPNLSPAAREVEVTTSARKVTLKGRVKTEQERMDIDLKARSQPGVVDVDDQIELVP